VLPIVSPLAEQLIVPEDTVPVPLSVWELWSVRVLVRPRRQRLRTAIVMVGEFADER